jgi:hypothetical protein
MPPKSVYDDVAYASRRAFAVWHEIGREVWEAVIRESKSDG